MLAKILLTIFLLVGAGAAQAQNAICPTAPFADSTNRCASTAFVQAAASSPLLSANSILGNNTGVAAHGTSLTALPSTFTGTSGHVLPYLDTANTWSGQQTFPVPSHGVGTLVANVASLASLAGDASVKLTTLGYSTGGDGGDAIYIGQASACSLNAGNGDGGSQIKGAGATCWLAQFPDGGADLREWGVKFDNSTDNSTALQSAYTWAAASCGALKFPYSNNPALFSTPITATISTTKCAPSFIGPGNDTSVLGYTGASGVGITINYTYRSNSTHWSGFTYCTTRANAATGLLLTQADLSASNPIDAGVTTFDIAMRGCDGYNVANYWATGIQIDGVSNVTWGGAFIFSGFNRLGNGVVLTGLSGPEIGGQYSFIASKFNWVQNAVAAGPYYQGLIFNGANITAVEICVLSNSGVGTDQLVFSGGQCEFSAQGIWNSTADLNVNNNLLIPDANNAIAVYLQGSNRANITNNEIYNSTGLLTGLVGVRIDAETSGMPVVVSGNTFDGIATPAYYPNVGTYDDVWSGNIYKSSGGPTLAVGATVLNDQPLPFASVAACSATNKGRMQQISDSNTAVWGATVAGGGANYVLSLCNAAPAWTVMGK